MVSRKKYWKIAGVITIGLMTGLMALGLISERIDARYKAGYLSQLQEVKTCAQLETVKAYVAQRSVDDNITLDPNYVLARNARARELGC